MFRLKIALTICLVAGPPILAATFPLHRPDYNRDAERRMPITVVVAKENLPIGLVLLEPTKYLEQRKVLPEYAPKGCYSEIDDIKNHTLGKDVAKGTWILKSDLWDYCDWDTTLKVLKSQGQVACTIPVYPMGINGNNFLPMDRVNVRFWSKEVADASPPRVIMRNVRVLGSDIPAAGGKDEGISSLVTLITLAVTTEQAQELRSATAQGKLDLTIFKDESLLNTPPRKPVTLQDLIKEGAHQLNREDNESDR